MKTQEYARSLYCNLIGVFAFLVCISNGWATPEEDRNWINARTAGITITQGQDPDTLEPTGTIAVGGITADLGETPPFYQYQMKTAATPILIGKKDFRRSFGLYVDTVIQKDNAVSVKGALWVSYPDSWYADAGLQSSGGLAFKRGEEKVTKIGVIIPDVVVPEEESGDDWAIQIRVNDRASNVDLLSKAQLEPLDASCVLVMPTHPNAIPQTARVLWLTINADGTLSVPLAADQSWQGYAQNGAAATQVPRLITDQATFAQAWNTCERTDSCPDIDFSKKFVYAATAKASHVSINSVSLKNDGLKIQLVDTADTPPGFSYVFGIFSREGVASVNGVALSN